LLENEPANTSRPSSELSTDSIRPVGNCTGFRFGMFDSVGLTSLIVATTASPSMFKRCPAPLNPGGPGERSRHHEQPDDDQRLDSPVVTGTSRDRLLMKHFSLCTRGLGTATRII